MPHPVPVPQVLVEERGSRVVGLAHSLTGFAKDHLFKVGHEALIHSLWHKVAGDFTSGDLDKCLGGDIKHL